MESSEPNGVRDSLRSETAAALQRGAPVALGIFVLGLVAISVAELVDHPERLTAAAGAAAAQLVLGAAAYGAHRRMGRATRARSVIVAMVLIGLAIMTVYNVAVRANAELFALWLTIVLVGLSQLIPIGAWAQGIIAAFALAGFTAALAGGALSVLSPAVVWISLASVATVTVVGAYLTDQQHRDAVRARDAVRREAEIATTLIDISQELNATLSRAEVLTRLARRAVQVFGAPIGAINLIEAGRMRIVEACGLPEAEARAARAMYLTVDDIPGGWELLAQPLIELPDVRQQPLFPAELLLQFGYSGLLIAPMRRGATIVGSVSFMYREPRAPFTDHERMLARGLAEQAALALENARLYEEQQEAAEIATALLHVAETIGSSLDPEQVEQSLASLARDLLRCDGAAVYRHDDGRWRLTATVGSGLHIENVPEFRAMDFDDRAFPFFRELRRSGLVEIADRDAQDFVPAGLLKRSDVSSSLTVLLARGADPLAIIVVAHSDRSGAFSARERRVLSGLAQLGVVALTNAYLAEQLRGANRVKSEFVAAMSHELRTPLNAILGYADILRDQTLGPVQPAQLEALDRLHDRALDLLQMVQATLDLNRLEAGVPTLDWAEVTIGSFVESMRVQIPSRWMKPGVDLAFEVEGAERRLWTDTGKLHTVVRNLVHNALKFTIQGSVRISVRPGGNDTVIIEVRDTGCGIPPEQIGEIFEMFVQGGNTHTHDGVGLGLHLCRRFVTLLGGQIEVDSQTGKGSLFRVRLPVGARLVADAATTPAGDATVVVPVRL